MNLSSSVVIATRNRLDDITTCLKSLKKQTVYPNELIIIDSSDTPLNKQNKFLDYFSNTFFKKPIKLIYKHTSRGAAYQRNVGIKLVTTDIVHFFDDDVILQPNYIEKMNLVFQENPNYAGGMGDIENIPPKINNLWIILRKIFLLQRIYASGTFTVSGMPTHPYGTNKFKKVEVLGGCLMAYRTWALKDNIFDEKLTNYSYMEDCDLSKRVSKNYPLFFNPHAKLKHLESPVSREKIEDNRTVYIRNYTYLFFKNFYPKNRLKIIFYTWSIIGLFTEAILSRNSKALKGYARGLKNFYVDKNLRT